MSRTSRLAWALAAELFRVGASTAVFLILARELGVSDYGTYAAVFSIVTAVAPFANLGAGHLLIRDLAQGADAAGPAFGEALSRTFAGAILGLLALTMAKPLIFPEWPLGVLILVSLAELIGTATTELGVQAFFALGATRDASIVRLAVGLLRLGAAFVLVALPVPSHMVLFVWCLQYAFASAVGLTLCLIFARKRGRMSLRLVPITRSTAFIGLPFSMNVSAAYIQDDADKAIVFRSAGAAEAGVYAAGYRIMNLAYIPLRAALMVLYPKFFAAAGMGSSQAWALLRRCLPVALLYGFGTALVLIVASPLASDVLGPGFAEARSVLVLISWLPLVRSLTYLMADYCTCMGYQWLRVGIQVGGALSNIVANLCLVPSLGWRGAVWASAISEVLTVCCLIGGVSFVRRRGGRLSNGPLRVGAEEA